MCSIRGTALGRSRSTGRDSQTRISFSSIPVRAAVLHGIQLEYSWSCLNVTTAAADRSPSLLSPLARLRRICTQGRGFSAWQTAGPGRTGANSSSRAPKRSGSTVSVATLRRKQLCTALIVFCLSCFEIPSCCVCQSISWPSLLALPGKHVVFGRVLGDGLLVLRKLENVATGQNNKPKLPCLIAECGEM